jgi:hypothetical protein
MGNKAPYQSNHLIDEFQVFKQAPSGPVFFYPIFPGYGKLPSFSDNLKSLNLNCFSYEKIKILRSPNRENS